MGMRCWIRAWVRSTAKLGPRPTVQQACLPPKHAILAKQNPRPVSYVKKTFNLSACVLQPGSNGRAGRCGGAAAAHAPADAASGAAPGDRPARRGCPSTSGSGSSCTASLIFGRGLWMNLPSLCQLEPSCGHAGLHVNQSYQNK